MMNFDLILKDVEAKSNVEVLELLASELYARGVVKDTFQESVIERELNFPTGLELDTINVALPHADSKHVNSNSIAVATMKNEVEFSLMTDPDYKMGVKIVFLLALKDGSSHMAVLRSLIDIIQNQETLDLMLKSDVEGIREILLQKFTL